MRPCRALPLSPADAEALPEAQGVSLLLHEGRVRYVGKTDAEAGMRTRLTRHARKFERRRNVRPEDIGCKAAQIPVLTATHPAPASRSARA